MKQLAKLLLIASLAAPGLLMAETVEVIPWNLNPDEEGGEQEGETSASEDNEGDDEDEDLEDAGKEKSEETAENEESEGEYNFDIKINKDYPDSYFYPGPDQRTEPSFGIPDR